MFLRLVVRKNEIEVHTVLIEDFLIERKSDVKKFRGKSRYFRFMWSEIRAYDLEIDEDMWFAFKHHHLDFFGYGRKSGKLRREHIKGHLALLDQVLEQLEAFPKPYQAWIILNDTYPEYDAVYVHSPNPYDAFPYKSEDLHETTKLPAVYRDLIDLTKYTVTVSEGDGQICYCLQVKGKGLAIHETNRV